MYKYTVVAKPFDPEFEIRFLNFNPDYVPYIDEFGTGGTARLVGFYKTIAGANKAVERAIDCLMGNTGFSRESVLKNFSVQIYLNNINDKHFNFGW